MGTITVRHSKKGVVSWQVTVRKVGEQTITGTFKDRRSAEDFDREVTARMAKAVAAKGPSTSLPATGNLNDEKLVDTFAMFAASDACGERHRKLMPAIVRNIGDVTIGELRPSWGLAYIAKMRKQVTRRKTNYCYESIVGQLCMINAVLEWRGDRLDITPPKLRFDTKKLPKGWARKRTRRLEAGEEAALMKRLSEVKSSAALHWPLLAKLAIETGARLQELVLAEWSEISDEVEFWTIPETHTKSKKERVMPLTSGAIETLRALKAIRDQADARIFHALGNPTAVSAFFHRMTQQAGLVDFRFHDLRHEAISRLVLSQRNFSVYEILQMVGHSSPTMLNRYTNLRGDELAQKMIRIDAPAAAPLLVPKPSGSDTPKPPQENAAGTGSIPLLPSTVLFYGQPGSAAMKVWQPGGRGQPPTHH